ncbi:MAG: protein kinase [Planctomycetota bacterium]
MRITCRECGHAFDDLPNGGHVEGETPEVCPNCGATVDVAGQIAEMTARTTDGAEGRPADGGPRGSDLTDRSIGDYEILEEISRGAMGVVYKARHRRLGRVVALKVMIAGEHASPEQVTRFEKEARAAARLRHPNLVPIYEVGIEKGKRFFTMDFIEGTPLDVLISREELTPRRAIEIAAELADALHYAHEQGVIHRDIKPSNIMVDGHGRPQIMDFGLAKQLDTDTKFTRTGTTIGTPSYMAPEQARGENEQIDQRSDVYSLGAVMYEMLTGRPPFTGETMMNIVMKVIHDEPASLRRLNPRLHRDIQTIVLKAMEKEPGRRYQTMGALGADIRRYMTGEMITARPAGPLRRTGKFLRKHRTTIVVGLTIALIASAISGLVIRTVIREQEEREEAFKKKQENAAQARLERLLSTSEQEPEWVPKFEEDFEGDELSDSWKPSTKEWALKDGRLTITSETQKPSHILCDRSFQGKIIIEYVARTPSEGARINFFLGRNPRLGYAIRYGEWDGNNISLLRRGKLLAQVECPPIQPGVPYTFRVERRGSVLLFRASANGESHELRYEDPALLRDLGQIRFGFDTWASTVQFDRVTVSREEFPGERLNKLQAIEYYMLSKGLLAKALAEYQDVIEKHEGRLIAVLAQHHCGLILEALEQDEEEELKAALDHYERFEAGSGLLEAKHAPLAEHNLERKFFVLVSLGRYQQAADELAEACAAGRELDPGSAWKFPAILARCAGDLAFGPAVRIMEEARFAGDGPRLRDHWRLAGRKMRGAFTAALNEICRGLAAQKRYDEMKRAFLAMPDIGAARSFEIAVADALKGKNDLAALDLLAFSRDHGMTSRRLEQSALQLAGRFIAAGQYKRVSNVRQAYPTRGLVRYFNDAVVQLVRAEDREGAVELFDEACRRFHADSRRLQEAARALMEACLATKEYVQLRRVYGMYPDKRFANYLVAATRAQIEAGALDGAYAMLEYTRANAPERADELGRLAGALATRFVQAGRPAQLIELSDRYSDKHLAGPFTEAISNVSRIGDAPLLVSLMSRGLGRFPDHSGVVASAREAARMLIEEGEINAVVRAYENAARAQGEDKATAATLLSRSARVLRAGRAYSEAAAAYRAAAGAAPAELDEVPGWLLRAGAIYAALDESAAAGQAWRQLGERAEKGSKHAAVARLMSGLATIEEFAEWRSEHAGELPETEAVFFLGLRAAALRRPELARKHLTAAATANKSTWYHGLAQVALAGLREIEPRPELPPIP